MGASSPPGTPAGGALAPRSRKPLVLIVVAVIVVAVLAGVVYVLLSTPTTPPTQPTLARVNLTAARTTIDQREELVVNAAAFDTDDVDQTSNVTFAWSANPSTRVQGATGAGASKNVIALQAGAVTITATATLAGVSKSGTVTLTITALSFRLTPSTTTPMVGASFDLDVEVLRGVATATSYRGTVNVTSDDVTATLPANTTFGAADNGMRAFAGLRVGQARAVVITVRDTIADIVATATVTGQRPPSAPIASFNATRTLMQVSVDATDSRDPDNDIATYAWAWGDGQTTAGSASTTTSHTYTNPGKYTIVLTVTDLTSGTDVTTRDVSVATSTIDYEYWDFFNVPYRDYWDLRIAFGYYELPINAECFTQTGIDQGLCFASDPNVPDVTSYPYTHWYSANRPGFPNFNPVIYAPYRLRAVANDVGGYNLSEPVFLPVSNYGAPVGSRLDFTWTYQYMNQTRGDELGIICATNWVFGNDGYISENRIRLTLDLAESRRIFGVVAATGPQAWNWWAANTNPDCGVQGTAETALENWFVASGGTQFTLAKYDIINGYEWYYQPFATNINWTVDNATGLTTLDIIHVGYGTEALLGRWFYWGNVSYLSEHLDSTKARGWWGMEQSWFEDFSYSGSLGTASMDFTLETAVNYNLQHQCGPGPNLAFDRIDDEARWVWGPWLLDYVDDFYPQHPVTELDRYGGPDGDAGTNDDLTYLACTPGAPGGIGATYGSNVPYDLTPETWDLRDGETWRFRFPTGNVVFYDPNLTPAGANPTLGEFVNFTAPFEFVGTKPANFGSYDLATKTWTVLGRATTGGPVGSPGLDGVVGTGDDAYPDSPWPLIVFTNGTPVPASPFVGFAPADIAGASDGTGLRDSRPAAPRSAGGAMDPIASSGGSLSAAGRSPTDRYWTTRWASRLMTLLVPRPTGLSAG